MHEQARTTLEVIAPTVDEAVAKGLAQLGLPLEAVEVEILDRGGRGLFGLLGHRDARVRLVVKAAPEATSAPAQEAQVQPQPSAPRQEAREAPRERGRGPRESRRRRGKGRSRRGGANRAQRQQPRAEAAPAPSRADDEEILRITQETVAELLEKMGIQAEVRTHYGEAEKGHRPPVMVDITGRDLSILIGRRAERLNALQFITRLIVGKEVGRTVTIIVDVENYRKRREQQLRRMAKRLADQAARTGRRIAMEPMPANERRIVHIALRDDPRVTTESVGR
ncbi:MAG: hypothetical protein GXO56_07895, partial [Chloroflexi bacterium]|nr:hypothetical protein [Chloroflexota bacterium]